jgi:hypothetical protein
MGKSRAERQAERAASMGQIICHRGIMLFDETLPPEDRHAGTGPIFLTIRACLLGQSKSPGHEQDNKDDEKQSARSVVVSAAKSVATEEKKNQQNDQDYAERRKTGRCDFIGYFHAATLHSQYYWYQAECFSADVFFDQEFSLLTHLSRKRCLHNPAVCASRFFLPRCEGSRGCSSGRDLRSWGCHTKPGGSKLRKF